MQLAVFYRIKKIARIKRPGTGEPVGLYSFMKDDQRAERWLRRAAEIRAEALAMPRTDAQATLLKLAADWEHMGTKARERAASEGNSSLRQPAPSPGWSEIPNKRGDAPPRH